MSLVVLVKSQPPVKQQEKIIPDPGNHEFPHPDKMDRNSNSLRKRRTLDHFLPYPTSIQHETTKANTGLPRTGRRKMIQSKHLSSNMCASVTSAFFQRTSSPAKNFSIPANACFHYCFAMGWYNLCIPRGKN